MCNGTGKAKAVEEIIGKLGWWIDRQPKAKSHLNGRGGVLHATLRRDHLAFHWRPLDLLGTLRSTPFFFITCFIHCAIIIQLRHLTEHEVHLLVFTIVLQSAFTEILPRENCLCGNPVGCLFYRGNLTVAGPNRCTLPFGSCVPGFSNTRN